MRLNNREIYNYIKECIALKSHKSEEIMRKHCLTVEVMGDLDGSVSDTPAKFPPQFRQEGRRDFKSR